MKKPLFLLTLLASFTQASSQSNWSLGIRTGAELTKTYNEGQDETSIQTNAQLFITKRISKLLEVELNTAYKTPIRNSQFSTHFGLGPQYYHSSDRTTYIEFGIAARYFIANKKGWSPYILGGINTAKITTLTYSYNSAYTGWAGPIAEGYYSDKYSEYSFPSEVYLGFGINKSIATNWKLNAQLAIDYNVNQLNTYYITDELSPKLQCGIAYCW